MARHQPWLVSNGDVPDGATGVVYGVLWCCANLLSVVGFYWLLQVLRANRSLKPASRPVA